MGLVVSNVLNSQPRPTLSPKLSLLLHVASFLAAKFDLQTINPKLVWGDNSISLLVVLECA